MRDRTNQINNELEPTTLDLIEKLDGMEQQLKDSEERFAEIFKQNFDAIILFKVSDFSVQEANPEAIGLFGFPVETLTNDFSCVFPNRDMYDTFKAEMLDPDNVFNGLFIDRCRFLTCQGKEIVCRMKANVIKLHDNDVLYCVFNDITETVKMEDETRELQAQLIRANKMTAMGTLASGIAHEINNPNNYIMSNTQIFQQIWEDAVKVLKDQFHQIGEFDLGGLSFQEVERVVPQLLQATLEGSRRIKDITENLKVFSSPEETVSFSQVSINNVLSFAIKMLNNEIKRYTDCFSFVPGEGLPKFQGNAHQVEQVLVNLIQNALHSLPGREFGVKVTSSLNKSGTMISVIVKDEGVGMSKDVLGRITEPFFTTKYDQGGTGLGLYISYGIVEKHGGNLEFKSKPGKGTTAILKLPVSNKREDLGKNECH